MPERFSDADLLAFVNEAIQRAAVVRPDLFLVSEDITPTVGQVEQTLPATVTRISELHRIVGGAALGEVDKETMDRSAPNWTTDTADTPVNWVRHPRNPRKYFLYPRPSTGTQIAAEFVEVPDAYALGDTMILPDSYKSAVIDCVVALAEIIDNEHVETARAKSFFESFMQALGADLSQRTLIDNENGQPAETRSDRRRG